MRKLAPILFGVSLLAVGISASGIACPNSSGFRPSDDAKESCAETAEESLDQCRSFVKSLESIEDPTAQQRFDRTFSLELLGRLDTPIDHLEALDRKLLREWRQLHEEFPDDVQIMWKLSVLENEETSLKLRRNISNLAPDCTTNNKWLANDLDARTNFGNNREEQDSSLVRELVSVLDQGFEHAESDWTKIYFGHLKHREFLLAGKKSHAKRFRNRAIAELRPSNLPFQDDATESGWDLLCGLMGYQLRFAEICLDTIEKSLANAMEREKVCPEGAFDGASALANVLNPVRSFNSPSAFPTSTFRAYGATEDARLMNRLRELLESVPEDRQTCAFLDAYTLVKQ